MKLANKRGNEVGPEIVEEVEGDTVNVVSNTQLKVGLRLDVLEVSWSFPGHLW